MWFDHDDMKKTKIMILFTNKFYLLGPNEMYKENYFNRQKKLIYKKVIESKTHKLHINFYNVFT